MVVVDEPNAGTIYGGTVAAPIFKRIMQRALHHLSTAEHLIDRSPTSPRPEFGGAGAIFTKTAAHRPV
jgi:hypothetical protein